MKIPTTDNTPLFRTGFRDDAAWVALCVAVETPNADGFQAYISLIDDPAFADADPAVLIANSQSAPPHALIILADTGAFQAPEHPLLCIDWHTGRGLRVIASELWSIENNLSIANMDFADFANAADSDGVFRGFS
jgi:hypothetical protein